tara:strand:+ start:340 stop:1368 length:1029 start_codon:yes stop_codon:yes gene_type:complete
MPSVVLTGLKNAQFNGKRGELGEFHEETGRWSVDIGDRVLRVFWKNVSFLPLDAPPPTPDDDSDSEEDAPLSDRWKKNKSIVPSKPSAPASTLPLSGFSFQVLSSPTEAKEPTAEQAAAMRRLASLNAMLVGGTEPEQLRAKNILEREEAKMGEQQFQFVMDQLRGDKLSPGYAKIVLCRHGKQTKKISLWFCLLLRAAIDCFKGVGFHNERDDILKYVLTGDGAIVNETLETLKIFFDAANAKANATGADEYIQGYGRALYSAMKKKRAETDAAAGEESTAIIEAAGEEVKKQALALLGVTKLKKGRSLSGRKRGSEYLRGESDGKAYLSKKGEGKMKALK